VSPRRILMYSCLPLALVAVTSAQGCASDDSHAGPPVDSGAPDSGPSGETDAAVEEDADAGEPLIDDGGAPCNDDGWCRTPIPGVPAPWLKAVRSVSPSRALATGETCVRQGSLGVCTTSLYLWNGTTWTTVARALDRLTGIWASDADHFWVVNDQRKSLYRVTFNGSEPTLVAEQLPVDLRTCGDARLTIGGASEADIYVAAYCYNYDQTTRAMLLHRSRAAAGGAPTWSTVWEAGASDVQAGLGAIFVTPSGEVLAAGWKVHSATGGWGARYFIPNVMNTLLLHVTGGNVVEEELEPSLAMCAQSIWSSSDGSLFVGGVCDSGYLDFKKYTTLARYGEAPGGGKGWSGVYQTSTGEGGAVGTSFPTLWGFTSNEVYAVGSWATAWSGSALKPVNLAIHGAPVANRIESVHGSSPNDLWMVGNGFAMHRAH
jgi:hypothetical protein